MSVTFEIIDGNKCFTILKANLDRVNFIYSLESA